MKLIVSAFLLLVTACPVTFADDQNSDFVDRVKPIFVAKCGKCHSSKVQKSGLNLSSLEGLLNGGESGDDLLTDKLEDSPLWELVESGEMPPEGEPPLTATEIESVKKWLQSARQKRKPKQVSQHDVVPVLLLRCAACHGRQLRQGGLDLRSIKSLKKGGDSGPAFVVGKAAESRMIQRIETEACPPGNQLLKYFVRRPTSGETETLKEWINNGAQELAIEPDVATRKLDALVTNRDRQHWAFRPLTRLNESQSVDDLVVSKLSKAGLTFATPANRDALIRRAYLDLTGLPPDVGDWQKWKGDPSPDWYPRMLDHLLASPQYGERWGRYWLDIAGYADSEGGVSADPRRQVAWKYRDYVIRAFNRDLSYDTFLQQQIAGDEMVNFGPDAKINASTVEHLVATGFLRMGIDQTGSRTMNFVPERLGVVADAIAVIGSGVLGLTLECARCHTHKYDPIPHRDYYRFKAIFQGAFDEHDWLTFRNRKLDIATKEHRQRVMKANPALKKQIKKLTSQIRTAKNDLNLAILESHYPNQAARDNVATLAALKVADNNRTQPQRTLVERLQNATLREKQPERVLRAEKRLGQLEAALVETQKKLIPPTTIRALWDRGEPSPTYILRRGEHNKPGRLVGPGVPSVLTDGQTPFKYESPDGKKTGRRLAFAKWLTSPDHPLTARVLVNRVWYHHFGRGIVASLENFGVKGSPPTHPALLDSLARQFVESGWSIKALHKRIMMSKTYRQSSYVSDRAKQVDPQNKLWSRMPLRRMDAEALRDSLLFVAGALDTTPGGPPDTITIDREGLVQLRESRPNQWRRSVYAQFRRTELPTLLSSFDYPEMGPNCVARNTSTVSTQSLYLMNNERVRRLAGLMADKILAEVPSTKEDRAARLVERLYQAALSRDPKPLERKLMLNAFDKIESVTHNESKTMESMCHTLLNSAAFLYID